MLKEIAAIRRVSLGRSTGTAGNWINDAFLKMLKCTGVFNQRPGTFGQGVMPITVPLSTHSYARLRTIFEMGVPRCPYKLYQLQSSSVWPGPAYWALKSSER